MVKTRTKAAEWVRRVALWESSGETAEAFAAREGWNARTLTWWGAQFRRRGGRDAATSLTPSFVKVVERRETAAAAAPLELVVPRIGTVRISTGTDLVFLRAVVDALGVRE